MIYLLYKSPRSFLQRLWGLCSFCTFSAPAAHAKTPLFTAREPLWHAKTPLFIAQEPLWHAKWPLNTAIYRTGATLALKMAAPVCPGAAGALGRAVRACFGATRALKMAAPACPGAASALEKPVRACFSASSALKESVRACCSRSLFKSAGLGCTVL